MATMFIDGSHNRISLLAAQIPRSWYLIRSPDDKIVLDGVIHTLTSGNYSAIALAAHINTLITPATITFSLVTSKYTLTSSVSSIYVPSPRLRRILGLAIGTTAISGSLVFPNCVYCTACSQVWVACSLVVNDSVNDAVGNALSHIFVNQAPDQALIAWTNPAPRESSRALSLMQGYSTGRSSVQCQFRFLDDFEEGINFNGLPVDLVVSTWREEPHVYGLLNEWARLWAKMEQEKVAQAAPAQPIPERNPTYSNF
jgi:hypothetical protein